MTVPPLRVGVLGAGYIARAHLAAYAADPRTDVVAIADPVASKVAALAGAHGAAACRDLDELLVVGVDAVSVCTPSPTHADVAVAAITAGCHVLCEKPIARTLVDAERIATAAEAAAVVVMVGHVSRYEPEHARAKRLVTAGTIGAVRSMTQSIRAPRPVWSEGDWLGDLAASGGPVVDLAIHSFDYFTWLSGATPTRVTGLAAGGAAGDDLDTYALTTVRYDSGAMALVESSWAHPASTGFELETEIVGERGRITWSYDGMHGGSVALAGAPKAPIDVLGGRGFADEIGAFVTAVVDGTPSPVPPREACSALRVALAAVESAASGRTVVLDARSGS